MATVDPFERQAPVTEQVLRRLYAITSASHPDFSSQVIALLRFGAEVFGLPVGILAHVDHDDYEVVAAVSPENALKAGDRFKLGETYCQRTLQTHGPVQVEHVAESDLWRGHPAYQKFQFECYIGIPIRVDGVLFGTLNFSSSTPKERTFSRAEIEILKLMSQWLSGVLEQRSTMEALRRTNASFRALLESTHDCIWEVNRAGKCTFVSQQSMDLLGYQPEEIIGHSIFDFMDKAEAKRVLELLRPLLDAESPYSCIENIRRHKDGHKVILETSAAPVFDQSGRLQAYRGVDRDITRHKRIDTDLRLAATAFETREAIMITDHAGTILRVNQAFSSITGYTTDEVIGKTPRVLKSGRHDNAFYRAFWQELIANGHWEGEVWNRRKDGAEYLQWENISAVRNDDGQITHYVAIFMDVTEYYQQRRRLERVAAEEQALSLLLRLSLEQTAMSEYLQKTLDTLLESVPWLQLVPKGGIFLADEDENLYLEASHNFAKPQINACQEVAFGYCLCGRAALSSETQFASCIDDRHDIHYPEMQPHGHYNIPILSDTAVLGVLVLYLLDGHIRDANECAFLERVADVISMGIVRRKAEERIEFHAYHDEVTGLPNRRLLMDHLERDLAAAQRHNTFGAALYLDLDNFKTLNDALGHPIGDILLRQVAETLTKRKRAEDTVARLGGDEFVVVVSDIAPNGGQAVYEVRQYSEMLRCRLSRPFDLEGYQYQITPSIGVVMFPQSGVDPVDIIKRADTAMYRAKAAGRNTIRFYEQGMQKTADARLALEKDLRQALEENQFKLYYQVQKEIHGRTVGAEALLRWKHPNRGYISPAEFIPVTEETGLINAVGDQVLDMAIVQVQRWQSSGLMKVISTLAINISPRQFHRHDFVDTIIDRLHRFDVDPRCLKLEITEGLIMDDVDATVAKMQVLKELGITFSIDDFGTGYSSLSYLKRLPLDELKIDQSFVRDIPGDRNDEGIVETILAMANTLGLSVVAEGVENEAQRYFLQARGCSRFQGFLYSVFEPQLDEKVL